MTAHTPTPWHVDDYACHNDYKLRLCEPMRNGFPLATIAQFQFKWKDAGQYDRQISYREAEANAQRAAACVNACEGIADPSVIPELLAALKSCVTKLTNCARGNGVNNWAIEGMIEPFLATIAKAEGKTNG